LFSDEKDYNTGRYPGVAMVSLAVQDYQPLSNELSSLLKESNVGEFGWKHLSSAKYKFAAKRLVTFAVEKARLGKLRIDVLTWDRQDERRRVPNPDDIANLSQMYRHGFRNVIRTRYPSDALWLFCPDQHGAIAWNDIHSKLERRSFSVFPDLPLLPNDDLLERLRIDYSILAIDECDSEFEPLVQLADLFVGLGCDSRKHYAEFKEWQQDNSPQAGLFATEAHDPLSNANKHRFPIIQMLDSLCHKHKMGVSLKTHKGFRTMDPKNPINFWWYTPQHENDKAISKNR